MRVLLRLGDPGLLHALGRQPLAEGIGDIDLLEGDLLVGDLGIVVLEADVEDLFPGAAVKLAELVVAEAVSDLPGAVRAEIEEDDGVAVLDHGHRLTVLHDDRGLDELIRLVAVIGSLDGLRGAGRREALALRQSVIGDLDAVVVVVPVHRIVAAADHGDLTDADLLHLVFELGQIIDAALGRCVASVQEAVHIYPVEAVALRHFKESVQMRIVAVHTAVRQKSVKVQIGAPHLAVVDRGKKLGILEKLAVLDLLGDPGQLLIHDPAGAHVHVADLRIAHLAVRKSDRHAAGISLDKRILLHQAVHHRRLCHGDCIRLGILVQPVSVQDH